MEKWALIRRFHVSDGVPKARITKRLVLSRNAVAKAIASESPPVFHRSVVPSAFDAFEVRVRALLTDVPLMPATVIAERVGWSGSPSWFRKEIALLRPEYAPRDLTDRLSYRPGDQAQCDLRFSPEKVPLAPGQAGSPPVVVIVASYSRFITAIMLPVMRPLVAYCASMVLCFKYA